MKSFHRLSGALAALVFPVAAFAGAGQLDTTFAWNGFRLLDFTQSATHNDVLGAVAVTADQRIVTVGIANLTGSTLDLGIARTLANGATDTTFGNGTGMLVLPGSSFQPGGTFSAYAMALQPDGRIVVAGTYTGPGSSSNDFLIARVLADGSGPDTTFGANGIVVVPFDIGGEKIDVATAVAVQSDGRIVAAGAARISANDADFALVRLNANGSLDVTFDGDGKKTVWFDLGNAAQGYYDTASAIELQGDGKIVVAGSAVTAADGYDMVVARLTSTGALDGTFGNIGAGKSRVGFFAGRDDIANAVAVSELVVNPAGSRRIVIAGSAMATATDSDFAVAVLKDDGQLDSAFSGDGRTTIPFNLGAQPADTANAVMIQNGWTNVGSVPLQTRRIVVGGSAYGNVPSPHHEFALARLGFNGTLDATFGTAGKLHYAGDVDGNTQPNSAGVDAMARQGDYLVIAGTTQVMHGFPGLPIVDTDFYLSRVTLTP